MAISLYLSKEKRSNSKSDEEEFRLRNSSVIIKRQDSSEKGETECTGKTQKKLRSAM